MQYVLLMQDLNSFEHLLPHLKNSLQGQSLTRLHEQILQTGPQQVHQHHVVQTLRRNRMDLFRKDSTFGMPGAGPKELRYLYIFA